MKKRTRRVLFWLSVIIFGLSSWVVVRYAQGYKYDFTAGHFVRTGAVAVTANTDARLFVDDKLVGSLSFLNHRAGKSGLLPGTYDVRLIKDGWSTWNKQVVVKEGLLTDFISVLLLPIDETSQDDLHQEIRQSLAKNYTLASATPLPAVLPKPKKATTVKQFQLDNWLLKGNQLFDMTVASGSLVAEQVLGFMPISGNDRILWWTRNELWVMWIKNTDYQPYRAENERLLLYKWSVPISEAAWFRDRDHIVVDLGSSGGYRVLETDNRGGINIIKI